MGTQGCHLLTIPVAGILSLRNVTGIQMVELYGERGL